MLKLPLSPCSICGRATLPASNIPGWNTFTMLTAQHNRAPC
jgi:hypothetical protein